MFRYIKIVIIASMFFSSSVFAEGWEHHHHHYHGYENGYRNGYGNGYSYNPYFAREYISPPVVIAPQPYFIQPQVNSGYMPPIYGQYRGRW
ncbi:hypothetical protein [Methylomonas sp. AM2-LC]|uniref:hypothetical protein n=1 Tax=Methylomonas sp. AM2-LC TaxID=3153301 RepID=UPI003267D9D3